MLNAEADHLDEEASQSLSKTELLAQCITFMAAGYETTGRLLQFALYHIACLTEVQDRLQKEIDTVLAGSVGQSIMLCLTYVLAGTCHLRACHQHALPVPSDFGSTAHCSAGCSVSGSRERYCCPEVEVSL